MRRSRSIAEKDEDPFELIEKGNSLESSRNKWGSSEYYSRASSCLLRQYLSLDSQASENGSKDSCAKKEKKKIAALYHDQSVEYLNKARHCLIGALMFEREEDLKRWGDSEPMVDRLSSGITDEEQFEPLMTLITDEEMEKRINTFQRLFVSPLIDNTSYITKSDDDDVKLSKQDEPDTGDVNDRKVSNNDETNDTIASDGNSKLEKRLNSLEPIKNDLNNEIPEENLTLEERLARLDSTLPQNMKQISDDERYEKIKGGLDGLGIYISSQNNQSALDQTMSDDEQVDLIMSMAKDEVALEKGMDGDNKTVEEIMKRSGIRYDLPDEDLENDLLDPNDDEVAFWSSLAIEDEGNSKTNEMKSKISYSPLENDENDSDVDEFQDADDFKRCIAKSQQMLLQASLCLDEIDFSKVVNNFSKRIDENEMKEEIGPSTIKDEDIGNDNEGLIAQEKKEDNVNRLDREDDLNTEEKIEGDTQGALDEQKIVKNDENMDEECQRNSDKNLNYDQKYLKDNDSEGCGDGRKINTSRSTTDEKKEDDMLKESSMEEIHRIKSLGKNSIVRAHAMLERLIEAWPDERL